jgi:DNA-binding NarL/FixJ family response regulator
MIKILIADDHRLFREGLARMLSDTSEMMVVASVSNGEEAVAGVGEYRPDVILMDVNMPGLDGIEATRRLHANYPQVHILMLTVSEQDSALFSAVRAGARGYLLKSMSGEELVEAVRRANAGEAIIAPKMAVRLLDAFAALSAEGQQPDSGCDNLTDRERTVLQLVARGLSNKEIAATLSLSPHTAKAHLRSILDKLNLHSRTEAAAWAARHHLEKDRKD